MIAVLHPQHQDLLTIPIAQLGPYLGCNPSLNCTHGSALSSHPSSWPFPVKNRVSDGDPYAP